MDKLKSIAADGAKVVDDQVQGVADLYKTDGFTGVAKQVVKTQVAGKLASVLGPAVLAAGVARGVHGELTKPSPLTEAALPFAEALMAHLDGGDKEGAKAAVTGLFSIAPDTKRKDLAEHLHGLGLVWSEILASKIDEEKNSQGLVSKTAQRIADFIPIDRVKVWAGVTAEDRVKSIHVMIDQIELPKTPAVPMKSLRKV